MKYWFIIFILFTLFFGLLGTIFTVLSFVLYKLFQSKLVNFASVNEKPIPKQPQSESLIMHLGEIVENENSNIFDLNMVKSYKHILYYGTESEKIDFIGMVVYNPSSEFVNLIRIALNDDSEIVRILASTSLQKMEAYYEDKITQLEKESLNCEDTNERDSILLNLVNTYDNFIQSTLIDETLIDLYVEKLFTKFKNISNCNKSLVFLYPFVKLSVKYNKLEDIEEILLVMIKKKNRISDKFLLIEYYYKQSEFKKLYIVLKSIDKKKINNIKLLNSYDFWSQNYAK